MPLRIAPLRGDLDLPLSPYTHRRMKPTSCACRIYYLHGRGGWRLSRRPVACEVIFSDMTLGAVAPSEGEIDLVAEIPLVLESAWSASESEELGQLTGGEDMRRGRESGNI